MTYRFGYHDDSELVSNLKDYVVRWSLDLIGDTYGNEVVYSYVENPYPNDYGTVYPNKIEYNCDGLRKVEFVYDSSDRPYMWDIYRQGNRVQYSRNLKEIVVSFNDSLVSRHVLEYSTMPNAVLEFLSSVTEYGSDGSSSLSPVRFEYNGIDTGWTNGGIGLPGGSAGSPNDNRDEGYRFVDFNRDGLVDLVHNYCDDDFD